MDTFQRVIAFCFHDAKESRTGGTLTIIYFLFVFFIPLVSIIRRGCRRDIRRLWRFTLCRLLVLCLSLIETALLMPAPIIILRGIAFLRQCGYAVMQRFMQCLKKRAQAFLLACQNLLCNHADLSYVIIMICICIILLIANITETINITVGSIGKPNRSVFAAIPPLDPFEECHCQPICHAPHRTSAQPLPFVDGQ